MATDTVTAPDQPRAAPRVSAHPSSWIAAFAASTLAFIGTLATGRLLYEWLFPDLAWLGRPLPALLLAAVAAFFGWLLWRWLSRSRVARWNALLPFLPLALNLVYLFDPAVDLVRSRFLYLGALWLAIVLLARLLLRPAAWRWLPYLLIVSFLLPVYLGTMGRTVGTADTFEFQVVVPRLGIVHPTGYPLYLLLARLFTWLPFNDVAWRVNLATLLFGVAAVLVLYTLGRRLTGWILPSLLTAVIFGLTPTFWSQAIVAEVYSLHALIVVSALLLMREIGDWRLVTGDHDPDPAAPPTVALPAFTATVLLALLLGLGLANHLTTVILLPAAALAVLFAWRQDRFQPPRSIFGAIVIVAAAFLLPLLLYAYLPIRWSAVNGEPMGLERFIDWVIGGRFQGALQLRAWLSDSARYSVVGRLLVAEWPLAWGLPFIIAGLAYLFARTWRYALLLLLTWLGFVFYALNYYVPDLAVFLIPAILLMAIFWLAGLVAMLQLVARLLPERAATYRTFLQLSIVLLVAVPSLVSAASQTWATVDSSADDGRARWGAAVLDLPLPEGAAILADSDKFPPLYYLQQAEGLRPDLDIIILPDEGAYRAQLDARLAAGQPVYLARFLPGLESVYRLRSFGPLTEVTPEPLLDLPNDVEPADIAIESVRLLAYQLVPSSPFAAGEAAVTFYWSTAAPLDQPLHVYTRWTAEGYQGPALGQHPAGNTYPTVAWQPGEIVADYHALPMPGPSSGQELTLQVALAPPFTPAADLAWQTVTTIQRPPADPPLTSPLRAQVGPLFLEGLSVVQPSAQQQFLAVQIVGHAAVPDSLLVAAFPTGADPRAANWTAVDPLPLPATAPGASQDQRFIWPTSLPDELTLGSYDILVAYAGQDATCHWLARLSDFCPVSQIQLDRAPLPQGAANFDDKIALLSVDLPQKTLAPGLELHLALTWQALSSMSDDYTVFVQVVDAQDRLVGQVDAWPLQGTYPTSQWSAGELVSDPYLVRLSEELIPGEYRLYLGWYLLETLRRLPVLDQAGQPLDDKVIISGLTVPD